MTRGISCDTLLKSRDGFYAYCPRCGFKVRAPSNLDTSRIDKITCSGCFNKAICCFQNLYWKYVVNKAVEEKMPHKKSGMSKNEIVEPIKLDSPEQIFELFGDEND